MFLQEVLVTYLSNFLIFFYQLANEGMRVLCLVDVVDVQLEEGDNALDDVPVGRVLLVRIVPLEQDLVQLLVEFLDLLDVTEKQPLFCLTQYF